MVVIIRGKETPESMWRKFGKINYEENLVEELRDRKYFKKPSILRKEVDESRKGRKESRKKRLFLAAMGALPKRREEKRPRRK